MLLIPKMSPYNQHWPIGFWFGFCPNPECPSWASSKNTSHFQIDLKMPEIHREAKWHIDIHTFVLYIYRYLLFPSTLHPLSTSALHPVSAKGVCRHSMRQKHELKKLQGKIFLNKKTIIYEVPNNSLKYSSYRSKQSHLRYIYMYINIYIYI